ncbi:MAG TPA: ABC transporter ATP-binding protein, partial [Acidimicrobiia bacterium]|nr:ABC transporter ATP-binding protein [Acidimicrobiia bacterium]
MLELRGVTAGYGDTTVLRDVTLVVPEATTVALLGPNGAGKTTLLRVGSGLLRPESGAVFVDGVDMTGAAPHRMASLGICHVPEGRGIFPNLTVEENLVLQARGGGVAADTALERASHAFPKLSARLRQLAGTMSGGEQQMVALARAYVQEPRVVLLDEVSMGLAPKVVDEIFRFLSLLSQEGTALVLVEQYVTRALELADYAYLLAKGIVDFAG